MWCWELSPVRARQLIVPSLALNHLSHSSAPQWGLWGGCTARGSPSLSSLAVPALTLPCTYLYIPTIYIYIYIYLFIASVFPSEPYFLLASLGQTSTKSDKRKVAFPPEGYIIYEAYRLWEITQGRSNMSYILFYSRAANYLQAATSCSAPRG